MAFASALRVGVARDAISCGRQAALAARNAGVRRLGAVAAVPESDAPPLYSEAVLRVPETQMGKLSNGVRVATQAGSGPLASLSLSVNVGSRYESTGNNGICSVFGAAAFKGKEASIAALGGQFSVVVDREHVTYSATVLKADVPKAMEVLAAAVKATNVTPGTVEAAKSDIQAEIAAAYANPQLNFMDHLHDAAFLDTAMGMPVIGTAASVSGLTADGVKAFVEGNLAGTRVVVAGAGAVHQGALTDISESLLGDIVPTPPGTLEESLEPAYFMGSDKRMRFDSMKDARVAVAFKGPPAGSKYSMAIMLMHAVLGNYDEKSLLGDNAASKWRQDLASLSIAKSASPFYLPYKDASLIGVKGVVSDNNLDNFMWYTMWNMVYMCHKVTEAEVEMAKTHLKASLMQQASGSEGAAADISRQVMQHGRRLSAAELVARVDSVTVGDIRKMALEFINDQDHALAAVGPIHELPDYNWIRRRSFWLRY